MRLLLVERSARSTEAKWKDENGPRDDAVTALPTRRLALEVQEIPASPASARVSWRLSQKFRPNRELLETWLRNHQCQPRETDCSLW